MMCRATCLIVPALLLAAPAEATMKYGETRPCKIGAVQIDGTDFILQFTAPVRVRIYQDGANARVAHVSPNALMTGKGYSPDDPAQSVTLSVGQSFDVLGEGDDACSGKSAFPAGGPRLVVEGGLPASKDGLKPASAHNEIVPLSVEPKIEWRSISPLMRLNYSYPQELYDLKGLRLWFANRQAIQMKGVAEDLIDMEKSFDAAPEEGIHQQDYSAEWSVIGKTERFYSLMNTDYAYMGGAHGYYGTGMMLWDRKADAQVDSVQALFSDALLGLRKPYCAALAKVNAERAKEMDVPVDDSRACPAFKNLAIGLVAREGGKFSAVHIVANPYIYGSYADGYYKVTLPITKAVMATVRPEYRSAFEIAQ